MTTVYLFKFCEYLCWQSKMDYLFYPSSTFKVHWTTWNLVYLIWMIIDKTDAMIFWEHVKCIYYEINNKPKILVREWYCACVCVHTLNTFLFSLEIMGNFCSLKISCFVMRNFYHFENEGYLLEIFKDEVFQTKLCLCI